MKKQITLKRHVTGFRFEANALKGDWQIGEVLETPTSDFVTVIIQSPDENGILLMDTIAEFDVMQNGLDWAVRNTKRFMLDHGATADDVKLLKRKINAAAVYSGNRLRG